MTGLLKDGTHVGSATHWPWRGPLERREAFMVCGSAGGVTVAADG